MRFKGITLPHHNKAGKMHKEQPEPSCPKMLLFFSLEVYKDDPKYLRKDFACLIIQLIKQCEKLCIQRAIMIRIWYAAQGLCDGSLVLNASVFREHSGK